MNLTQYRDATLGIMGNVGDRRYPDTLINDLVNLARVNVVKWAKPSYYQHWYYCLTVANQARYNLSDIPAVGGEGSLDEIEYRYYDVSVNKSWRMDVKIIQQQDDDYEGWIEQVAVDQPRNLIQYGRQAIINPAPAQNNDRLEALILEKPTVLIDDGTQDAMPNEYQMYVLRLVVAELKMDYPMLQGLESELKALSKTEMNRGRPTIDQRNKVIGRN